MADAFRSVIEVLKWAELRTILKSAEEISRLWRQVCNSSELWREHLDTEGLTEHIDPEDHCLKSAFREAYLGRRQPRVLLATVRVMGIYDCKKHIFVRMCPMQSFRVDRYSAMALISHNVVMVCGGSHTARTQMYSILTQEVADLPDMLSPREYHSAYSYNQVVYVFGCNLEPASKTAERYHVAEKEWRQLPDMLNSRCCFNICRKNQLLYLCGGLTEECEMLDTVTLEYMQLPFNLPESNWTVSFFYHDQLVSVIHNNFYFLEPEGWKKVIVKMPYIALATSSALVCDDFVYIPMVSGSVLLEIDMKMRTCNRITITR